MITQLDLIASVRAAASIESVIGEDVSLEQFGDLLRGASPFEPEDDGSLRVDPRTGTFRCLATGRFGDVFVYVQLRKSCSFDSALKYLATRFL